MKKSILLTVLSFTIFLANLAHAQSTDSVASIKVKNKIYPSGSMEGALFSIGIDQGKTSTVRFSYFLNTGINFNYDLGNSISAYVGLSLKNLGYIWKDGGGTLKRRVYALGIPVGLKFGHNGRKSKSFIVGGGVDFPINYKEKTFTDGRRNKSKFNEWFSSRTASVMPYICAGVMFKSNMTLRFQYYPGNFMNPNYKDNNGLRIYQGEDVQLALLSVCFNVKGKHKGSGKKNIKAIMSPKTNVI